MVKINQHIEIVSSATIGLSSMGRASREAIQQVLGRHYRQVGITLVSTQQDLDELVERAPDLVVLGMKYIPKDLRQPHAVDGRVWLADYLANNDIATTGSQSIAHKLELDKSLAKQRVISAGLNSSTYKLAKASESVNQTHVPGAYPLFVKPSDRGGGAGIDSASVVHNFAELKAKIDSIRLKYQADSLIEEYLPGREFSVAILKQSERRDYIGMPLELIAPADKQGVRILSSSVKSADAEQVAPVPSGQLRDSIIDLAVDAFEAIGGRDYGRIDVRMGADGTVHFLEANLIPSLIDDYGSFPKACALNAAIGHEEMLLRIVELAMARSVAAEQPLTGAMRPVTVSS